MLLRRLLGWAIGCLMAGLLSASLAFAETRVALVIGNDEYATLPDLNNAGTDARGIAAKLRSLGFDVTLETNVGRRKIGRTLAAFRGKLAKADVGLVFYAGHGIQLEGENYLVPSDARVEIEEDLPYEAIRASDFLDAMADAGTPLNIVIIDACRDNPLPKRTRSGARGLTVLQAPRSIKGTAILYSAGAGQVAQDGPAGGHGVFTGALLQVLDRPGLKLEDVFKQTAAKVAAATGNKQDPWINSSVKGDFYFRGKPSNQAVVTPPAVGGGGADRDTALWKSVEGLGSADAYRAYLKEFPDGTYAGIAQLKIASLAPAPTVSAPRPIIDVMSLDQTMVVSGASLLNVRDFPGGEKVTEFLSGTEVEVTGRTEHEGSRWYRVALAGGAAGFVFGKYLVEKPASLVQPAVGVFAKPVIPPKPVEPEYTVGKVFSDCPSCPEMVVVPSGSFMMGSPASEPYRSDDEGPLHRVTIPAPFAVGKYEVTFSEWDACVSDGGCGGYRPKDHGWGRDRRPVINVSWDDAKKYVSWLSGKTGKAYRMLSESEWEYVARAGTTTAYHTGSGITKSQANFRGGKTVPVGRYAPNGLGLHDVHGNVWEWVEDCWAEDYKNAPVDGTVKATWDCSRRVFRGGSWYNGPRLLRSAIRGWLRTGERNYSSGFRVARTLPR